MTAARVAFVASILRGSRMDTYLTSITMTLQFQACPRLAAMPLAISFVFAALTHDVLAQAAIPPQNVLVTASRTAQSVTDVLLDHDIITADEIALAGMGSVAELLQKRRGVEIAANGGPGSVTSVFLRGSDNRQTVVLVDGVRVGASTTGGTTWASLPLNQIDHIEIVYGPLSSLYGADAVGGVIQIFTKQGNGQLAPRVVLRAGSYGSRSAELGLSGSTGGDHPLRFALRAGHERADGFSASKPGAGAFTYHPDNDGYKRDSLGLQLSWKLAKDHELGLNLMQNRINAQFDAGPGHDDRGIGKLENVGLVWKAEISPDWRSQLSAARSADRNATLASFGNSYADSISRQFAWQNDVRLGASSLQVLLEHRQERVESGTKDLQRERNTHSVATAWQMRQDAHSFSASLRYDDSSQYHGQTTGSLAYGYRLNKA